MLNQVDILYFGVKSKVLAASLVLGKLMVDIDTATLGDVMGLAKNLTLTGALALAVWYFMGQLKKEREAQSKSIEVERGKYEKELLAKDAKIAALESENRRITDELIQTLREMTKS